MRKKDKKILWILGIAILSLFIISQFSSKNANLSINNIPVVPFPTEVEPQIKVCDSDFCKFQAGLECNTGGPEPVVYFRASNTPGNEWIAWDLNPSDSQNTLSCFKAISNPTPSCNLDTIISQTISNEYPVFTSKTFYANSQYAFERKPAQLECGTHFFQFTTEPICDLSTIRVNSTKYTELTSGSEDRFVCKGIFEIYNPAGQMVYQDANTIQWVSGQKGSVNSSVISSVNGVQISNGWKAIFRNLAGSSDVHLWYGSFRQTESCGAGNVGVCLPEDQNGFSNGYKNCKIYPDGSTEIDPLNITYCTTAGTSCRNGKCVIPFQTKIIEIRNSLDNEQSGFTTTEAMKVYAKLIAEPGTPLYGVTSGSIRFDFYKVGESGTSLSTIQMTNYDFTSGSGRSVSIPNPSTDGDQGLFYLMVSAYDGSGNKVVSFGKDNPTQPDYQISIGSQVSCSMQLQTSITDIMTSKLLSNVPILVKLNTKVGGVGAAVTTKSGKVYMNKGTGTETSSSLNAVKSESASGDAYTYVYEYTTDKFGTIYAEATVESGGVPASCHIQSNVEEMKITSRFLNPSSCLPAGPHTFSFETYDTLNRPTDAVTTLCVKKPGSGTLCEPIASSDITPISGGKVGQYQFTYNLIKNSGETAQYTFKLSTHSNTYNKDYIVPDLNIEVKDTCAATECRTTADCSSKGATFICNTSTGKCIDSNPPYLLWLGIGVAILAGLVIIILVVKYIRKPKAQVYTGLDGGL